MLADNKHDKIDRIEARLTNVDPALTEKPASEIIPKSVPLPHVSRLERLFGNEFEEARFETPAHPRGPHREWMHEYTVRLSKEKCSDMLETLRTLRAKDIQVCELKEDLGMVVIYGAATATEKLRAQWKDCYFRPGLTVWGSFDR